MIYDLSTEFNARSFCCRARALIAKGAQVELTEKKPVVKVRQKAYLGLLLSYYATQKGITADEAKQNILKRIVCKDLFVVMRNYDGVVIEDWKSINDLTSEQMTFAITKFKEYATLNGVYLPDAEKPTELTEAKNETERYKQYVD